MQKGVARGWRKHGGGNDGHLRSLARSFIHLFTLLPFLFSPLCVLLIYRAAGKCLRHSPSIVRPSLSLFPPYSIAASSSSSAAASSSIFLHLLPPTPFPVRPVSLSPRSFSCTAPWRATLRSLLEYIDRLWPFWCSRGWFNVDGNLGNTARSLIEESLAVPLWKKRKPMAGRGEGVGQRFRSVRASSCSYEYTCIV